MASSDEEFDMDDVDVFHANREKASLRMYGSDRDTTDEGSESEEEEEVMGLESSSGGEEQEDNQRDVSVKAWGKRKSEYYAEESDIEREELERELEEGEALDVQRRLASAFSEEDFEAELFDEEKSGEIDEMVIPDNLAQMSVKEKHILMSHQHPELPQVIESLKRSFGTSLEHCALASDDASEQVKVMLETSICLNLCHTLNLLYYLLLKSDGLPTFSHPVTSTLVQVQKLKAKLEVVTDCIIHPECKEQPISPQQSPSLSPVQLDNELDNVVENPLTFYQRVDADKRSRKRRRDTNYAISEHDHAVELTGGKRAITYQIARNKGIGVQKRKRELRNPRVKHKVKYKQALIKRKSQVLPVVKELSKYGGETSGIRTNIARSMKILS